MAVAKRLLEESRRTCLGRKADRAQYAQDHAAENDGAPTPGSVEECYRPHKWFIDALHVPFACRARVRLCAVTRMVPPEKRTMVDIGGPDTGSHGSARPRCRRARRPQKITFAEMRARLARD